MEKQKKTDKLLAKAVVRFIELYMWAVDNDYIQKPISYSLYYTWEWVNGTEKAREKKDVGSN